MTAAATCRFGGIAAAPSSPDDRMKIGGVIRAPHQRAGGDVVEAFFAGDVAVKVKLLRRDVLDHWKMVRRRPKILAEGQNLTTHFTEIVHRLKKLRLGFAQSKHDAAFGNNGAA